MIQSLVPFLDSWSFNHVILPVLIFCSRICDVSLGTIRIIFISRGRKFLAPLLGFFEVLIWLIVITQVFRNVSNFTAYIAYAAGFATGNFVGIFIEEKLAIGFAAIRIIGSRNMAKIRDAMIRRGYGITCQKGVGSEGPVTIIYSMVKRKEIRNISAIIRKHNPGAFYSIEDARTANEGIFPKEKETLSRKIKYFFRFQRPGK